MPSPWLVLQWLLVGAVAWVLMLLVAGGLLSLRQMLRDRGEDGSPAEEVQAVPVIVQHEDGTAQEFADWNEFWAKEARHWDADTWRLEAKERDEDLPPWA